MNDNIFSNAENRVERFSFNKKEYRVIDTMSDSTLANQALGKIALRENAELEELENEKLEKRYQEQRRAQAVVEASLCDAKKTLSVNNWFADMKLTLFKDIVFETYYNALPLDADFLATVEGNIRHTINEYIDNNGGFKLLESAIEETNSRFLKNVKSCCETVAREACNKKLKETNDQSTLNFELSDEDFDLFSKKKGELDIDRISQLVKDKVITVIKDEKERQTKETELIEDIEAELTDDDSVTDNKSLDEAYDRIILNKLPVEEDTLFNSLMRSSYEELLHENVATVSAHEIDQNKEDEFNLSYDVNFTEDELNNSERYDDIDEPKADAEYDQTINDELHLQESVSLDMDKVFAEAISKYTLMETLYTIKLENYNYNNIKKLTEALLDKPKKNKVTESLFDPKGYTKSKEFVNEVNKAVNKLSANNQLISSGINNSYTFSIDLDKAVSILHSIGYESAKYGLTRSYGMSMDQLNCYKALKIGDKNGFMCAMCSRVDPPFSLKERRCQIVFTFTTKKWAV